MVFIFCLLFFTPFVVGLVGQSFFEVPKVFATEIGIVLLLGYTFFFKNPLFPKQSLHLYAMYTIFALSILHLIFFSTDLSFFGNSTRQQGIFLLWCLLLFSYVSKTYSLQNISWKIFAILVGFQGLTLLISPLSEDNRYVGFFGEPNAFAAYILFLWPFLYFSINKWRIIEKGMIGIMAFVVLTILFLTNSKSAMIGFCLQLLFLCINTYFKSYKKALLICALLYCSSYVLPFLSHAPYENRVDVWQTAVISGFKSPIVGNGFGNTEFAMEEVTKTTHHKLHDYYVDSAHNLFLDWWIQGGIIGVLSIVILLGSSMKTLVQHKMTKELILLIGLLTTLSFNPASVVSLVGFWWVIGRGWTNDIHTSGNATKM